MNMKTVLNWIVIQLHKERDYSFLSIAIGLVVAIIVFCGIKFQSEILEFLKKFGEKISLVILVLGILISIIDWISPIQYPQEYKYEKGKMIGQVNKKE